MKTLIIYASTYGYTEEMVKKMVSESDTNVEALNIVSNCDVELAKYDAVILGSSIYVGQIHKELKNFIQKNMNELLVKKLGIFLVCGFEAQFDTHIKNNFSEVLTQHATSIVYLGGKIQKDRLKFGHKLMVNMIEKTPEGMKPIPMYPNRTLDIVNQFNRA